MEMRKKEEKLALISQADIRIDWIIDSGCSHHMTCDKYKFIHLEKYNGCMVRFGHKTPKPIIGRGAITLDGKNNTDDVLYVDGLQHNLLSIGQLLDKDYQLEFKDNKCIINIKDCVMIASGSKTKGNVF